VEFRIVVVQNTQASKYSLIHAINVIYLIPIFLKESYPKRHLVLYLLCIFAA
jgi:hypothetical protein